MELDTKFIRELASSAPVPGGGGASAYVGALAAAAASMVANLTLGKKRYAEIEPQVRESLSRLGELTELLEKLVDADAKAFAPLAAAYKMSADTSEQIAEKDLAMQAALIGACDVPLEIMQTCVKVLRECNFLARNGSRLAVSDAGVAAVFAKAAIEGASLNVYINIGQMTDAALAESYRAKADALFADGTALGEGVFQMVLAEVGGTSALDVQAGCEM